MQKHFTPDIAGITPEIFLELTISVIAQSLFTEF